MLLTFLTYVFALLFILTTAQCPSQPNNFPSGIPLVVTNYENWAHERTVDNLWTATPQSPSDVVTLANWAATNNYKLRASGFQHTWAPLTVTIDTTECGNTVLLDTRSNLNQITMAQGSAYVTVQTGAEMNMLLQFLEERGYGFYNFPAIGKITVGGALSINGHGTCLPASGEQLPTGFTFGSLSNLIVNLTAVVWDTVGNSSYVLKTFKRTDIESSAFLVQLGRSFLIDITLQVGSNYNLRCVSRTDVSVDELFANSASGNTVAHFLDQSGRLDVTWFPYTQKPWIKTWTISPIRPLLSVPVFQPYNYNFQNFVPPEVSDLAAQMVNGAWYLAPTFGNTMYLATQAGLIGCSDIWGRSKNVLLYVVPTTLRMTDSGLGILTTRGNVQTVMNKFYTFYTTLLNQYQAQSQFPINGPINIRFNGLDKPIGADWVMPGISGLSPPDNNSPFDTAIWFNWLSFPNTPNYNEFMTKIESFLFENFNDQNAATRVEWSKGWGFTATGAWTNTTILSNMIPSSLQNGWTATVNTLNKYDPNHVFSNPFLDIVMKV